MVFNYKYAFYKLFNIYALILLLAVFTFATLNQASAQTNLALNGTATQSSTYISTSFSREAANAIDGNTSGEPIDQSYSVTDIEFQPWWQVDLGEIYEINSINTYNITVCCTDRETNFYVFVSKTPFPSANSVSSALADSNVTSFHHPGQMGLPSAFAVPAGTTGRYVRVQLNGSNHHNLAEVQVFGSPISPEINLVGNSANIADGYSVPSTSDHTDFGSAVLGAGLITGTTVVRTFTIQNTGTKALSIPNGVMLTGDADFSVTSQPTTSIAAGGSDTFEVTFTPVAGGVRNGEVSITNDDPDDDETIYNFNITGNAQEKGTITIVQNIQGPDTNVAFTSATLFLNFSLAINSGTGAHQISDLASGNYSITAQDLTSLGYGLTSITCDDNNSTANLSERTVSISLETNEQLTCTFSMVETKEHTAKLISNYLGNKSRLMLAHQPDMNGRLDRLRSGGEVPENLGQISALGYSAQTTLPFNASISESTFSFNSNLGEINNGAGNRLSSNELGNNSANSNEDNWKFWTSGQLSRFEGSSVDSGQFGVIHFGGDTLINEKTLFGVMGQYDWFENTASDTSRITSSGWMIGPYGILKLDEHLYFQGSTLWGRSKNLISPFNTYEDSFETERLLVKAALIGSFDLNTVRIQPAVKFQYIEEVQKAYTDGLGVQIDSQTISVGDLRFGPRFSSSHKMNDGSTVSPWVQVEGAYSINDEGNFTQGTYASDLDGLTGTLRGGIDFHQANGTLFSLAGHLNGLGSDGLAYGGTAKIVISGR